MKSTVLFLFFAFTIFLNGHAQESIKFDIIDSLVIKKKNQESLRIRVRLTLSDEEFDSLILYRFYLFTPSIPFLNSQDDLMRFSLTSVGLNYIIEDEDGNIIKARERLTPSYKDLKDEIQSSSIYFVVDTNNLTIRAIKSKDTAQTHENQLSKYKLTSYSKIIALYPLINKYHELKIGRAHV